MRVFQMQSDAILSRPKKLLACIKFGRTKFSIDFYFLHYYPGTWDNKNDSSHLTHRALHPSQKRTIIKLWFKRDKTLH